MTPTKKRAAQVRARVMYGLPLKDKYCVLRKTPGKGIVWTEKQQLYSILPRSREAQEAMVEQGAEAVMLNPDPDGDGSTEARAVLAALGLAPPAKGRSKT